MAQSRVAAPTTDPRHLGWPCSGTHSPGKEKSNQYSTWVSCKKCGLRLSYKVKASRGGHGETRSLGGPPEHVQLAQQELAQIYDAADMNEKIMLGKIMEIKGRQLLHTRGQCSAKLDVKANDRRGKEMLGQETAGYTAGPTPSTTMPGTASTGTPTPRTPTPAPTTPPRTTRSVSPSPSVRSLEPTAEAKAKAKAASKVMATPPQVTEPTLDEIVETLDDQPWMMAVEVVDD